MRSIFFLWRLWIGVEGKLYLILNFFWSEKFLECLLSIGLKRKGVKRGGKRFLLALYTAGAALEIEDEAGGGGGGEVGVGGG